MADSIMMYAIVTGVFVALVILLGASRARRPKGEMAEEQASHGGESHGEKKKMKRYDSNGKPIE